MKKKWAAAATGGAAAVYNLIKVNYFHFFVIQFSSFPNESNLVL
jgi:hypothetical protein